MIENPRKFEATDPFGRKWQVEFQWHQTAISIRHSDSVDVKWELMADDGTSMERVIALMLPSLNVVAKKLGRGVTDSWCVRLAALHLVRMIETWEDADKIILTPAVEEIEGYAKTLSAEVAAVR